MQTQKRGIDRSGSVVLHAATIERSNERRATPDASLWRRRQSQRPYRVRSALTRASAIATPKRGIDRSRSAVLHATTIDRSSERRATPDASRWRRRQSQRPYRERSALPSRECNRNSKTRNQSTPIGRLRLATIERSNERRATPDACRRRRWSVARPYRVRSALTSRECNRNSKTRYRSTPNGRTARSDDRSIS